MEITKKAVSKWERRLSLIDMSLLKPLSKILKVSITEILNEEQDIKEDKFQNRKSIARYN